MVRIKSAECLVLVAIAASAAALQVRERFAEPVVQRHAGFDERPVCEGAHGNVLPARCGTAQGMHSEQGIDEPRAMSRHNTGRHARPQGLWV
jgi:hypothetical protein